MSERTSISQSKASSPVSMNRGSVLQRQCACGTHTAGGGECAACSKKKLGLQRKLAIGASNDPLEREADRVADQVMAAPAHAAVSSTPPRIQRFAGQPVGEPDTAPASVDSVLAGSGRPLEPALRQDMEQRFGYDFSGVRVHSDAASGKSARHVNAYAYTSGYDIVFGAGRFAPRTVEGRRLLAHELTHVVQQTEGGGSDSAVSMQRKVAETGQFLAPEDLVDKYQGAMDQNFFGGLAGVLVDAVYSHQTPFQYVSEVFQALHSSDEDNVGAEFVKKLPEAKLDQIAKTYDGRYMLSIVYEAIITGDVTEFEREQANKVLMAKARAYKPEDYARMSKIREGGKRTRIFPIRFMRVTPGHDYAPPLAELMKNGKIRVKYPVSVLHMDMFKEEVATLDESFFLGEGEEINPNEIVGIKDYERGGGTLYVPALALIDYSNQAVYSTAGKIVEVSIFAATMGFGGGAAAGGGVAATEVRMTAIWAARLAKGAQMLDRIANVIGIASFVINENSDWIISKLGAPGKRLVQISNIANSVAGIYGIGRLAQGGYTIVKEMRSASNAARAHAGLLTQEEAVILQRLDNETDAMIKELDEAAAKSGGAAAPTPAEKPGVGSHVDDPAAVKAPAEKTSPKGESAKGSATGVDNPSHRPSKTGGDVDVVASHAMPDGDVIKITKDRKIWICTNPCDEFAERYRRLLEMNPALATDLNDIRKLADPKEVEKAIAALKVKAQLAPVTEFGYFALDGSYSSVVAGKKVTANTLRLSPADWEHIIESHVKSTLKPAARATKPVTTVFKGTPAQYLEILEEAVKNKAVIRELKAGHKEVKLMLRAQEWTLQVDLAEGAIKTFHASGLINHKLFEVNRPK